MAKKTSVVQSLEAAQKNAARELASTRKRIRAKNEVTSYEYCVLFEDSTAEAKKAAALIDKLLGEIASQTGPTPILICEGDKHVYAIMDPETLGLLPDGNWKMSYQKATSWNDSKPLSLQTEELKGPEVMKHGTPLHHFLQGRDRFVVVGEKNVAERLIKIPDKSKKNGNPPHYDRFSFFYNLTKKLGYELTEKKLRARVEEERERVTHDCERHVKSLEGVLEEFFVKGAREQMLGSKMSDGSAFLVGRAHTLCNDIRATLHECKLYEVETEMTLEIRTFATRWMRWNGIYLGD